MTRERILAGLGYTGFFFFAFILCAYWTFPYDRLAAFLTDKVAESGSGYTLEIGSISPYWLTGVELEDVSVRKTAAEEIASATPPKDKPIVDQAIKIPSAHARLGLFSLLLGGTSLSFGADLGTGSIDGSYEDGSDEKHVVGTLERVDLGKLAMLDALVPLPLKGMLTGDFDLTLAAQAAKTSGNIKLKIEKLVAGDGKAKLKLGSMGGLTIDPIAAGDVNIDIDVKNGVGTVKKLTTSGPDLRLEGSGDIRFAQPLSRSRLGVVLRLELTDAYRNKTPRTQTMFTLLEGASSPQVTAAKTPDGAYQVRLTGPLTSPRVLPAGQSPAGGAAMGGLPTPTALPGDDDD